MRTFKVTLTKKRNETFIGYFDDETALKESKNLPLSNERIYNPRYQKIEETGHYYRISELCKGGQALIFEITE